MKLEITQSMIGMFEKCGRQFQFRYLDKVIAPPQAALTVGSAVDDGVTLNLSQKITSGTDLPEQDVLDSTSSSFDRRKDDTDWQGEDPGRQKDIAIRLIRLQHKTFAPKIEPIKVQQKLTLDRGEYILGGTLDIVDKTGVVVDTKTSKDAYKPDSVSTNLQPGMYSLLSGREEFRYDVLIKPKFNIKSITEERAQQVRGIVPERSRQMAIKRAEALKRAIDLGTFHYASELGWWCNAKWCGYWNFCERGGKK